MQWSSIFMGTVFLLNKHLQLSFFHRYRVNPQVQFQPSTRWMNFFSWKRVIAATHSFKFILQNRNCSKGILIIILIMIPPCFQTCIDWKKSVIWRHHFQPSIFSLIVSLFQGATWDNSRQKNCVYFTALVATIHYNKQSVIGVDSTKIEGYVYLRKTIVALLF